MIEDVKKSTEERMQKSVQSLKDDLMKLRTGRAHPSLLENIMVDYYGNPTPLSQVANVAIENARTLTVTPWEKDMVAKVEKAIMTADLGLNPATSGTVIRVPLPPLTEERRKDLTKVVRDEAERARVAIRNIRREAIGDCKDLVKAKEISEDDERRAQADIQKITDKYVAEVDKVASAKEKDLMAI
ncbi:MAG: ribosome recycling factor [Coxiellaceae bacterium]|nr:ribosome recycling factor [Coxiellaceae bacterium]